MPTVDEPGLQQGQRQLVLGTDPETVVAGMRVALVKFEVRPATRISVSPDIDLSERSVCPGAGTVLHLEAIRPVALGHGLVVGLRPDAVMRPDFLGVRMGHRDIDRCRSRWNASLRNRSIV